jgi:hypothetical protein
MEGGASRVMECEVSLPYEVDCVYHHGALRIKDDDTPVEKYTVCRRVITRENRVVFSSIN